MEGYAHKHNSWLNLLNSYVYAQSFMYIVSILFKHKHLMCIYMYKLHNSGATCHFLFLKPPQVISHCFLTYQLTGLT